MCNCVSGYKFFRSSLIVSWVGCKYVCESVQMSSHGLWCVGYVFEFGCMWERQLLTLVSEVCICVWGISSSSLMVSEVYVFMEFSSLMSVRVLVLLMWSLMCVWLVGQITRSLRYVCYILCDMSASSSTCGGSIWISSITCLINSERSF